MARILMEWSSWCYGKSLELESVSVSVSDRIDDLERLHELNRVARAGLFQLGSV